MTTKEVALKLVNYGKQGKWMEAQAELYAEDAVSIEPAGTPWESAEGMDAIKKKAEQWSDMIEAFHGNEIGEPIVSGNFFAVRMQSDTTMKGAGRMQLDELGIYEVKDGKVVKEQFFYTPMQP